MFIPAVGWVLNWVTAFWIFSRKSTILWAAPSRYILFARKCHTFSMTFRSELKAGHPRSSTPFASRNNRVAVDVWAGALSCCSSQSFPNSYESKVWWKFFIFGWIDDALDLTVVQLTRKHQHSPNHDSTTPPVAEGVFSSCFLNVVKTFESLDRLN